MQRLGVFGGAFDPVHRAHIALASAAKTQFSLDRVLLMPTGNPAHRAPSQTAAQHRLNMLALSVSDIDGLEADATEIEDPSIAYTYTTIQKLYRPTDYEIFLLMGEDSLDQFTSWHRWQDILDLCHLCVAKRHGVVSRTMDSSLASRVTEFNAHSTYPLGRIFYIDTEAISVSSTEIRQGLKQQADLGDSLSPQVMQYIRENGLYEYG